MEEIKYIKCEYCGREAPEHTFNRDGECCWCRAESKSMDMSVGDLHTK